MTSRQLRSRPNRGPVVRPDSSSEGSNNSGDSDYTPETHPTQSPDSNGPRVAAGRQPVQPVAPPSEATPPLPHTEQEGASRTVASNLTQPRIMEAGPSSVPSADTAEHLTQPDNFIRLTEPVEKWPGVYTDNLLRSLNLGILVEYQVLFCTTCPISADAKYGVANAYDALKAHLKNHEFKIQQKGVRNKITTVNTRYDAWDGDQGKLLPNPQGVIPPIPFLPIITNDIDRTFARCPICARDGKKPFIWVSATSMYKHYRKCHSGEILPAAGGLMPLPVAAMQTFYSS
ncbi:hypothetical protein FRC11_011623 [Ceratobasidium sp. 423]|nr:hypothetical protein FRC11_011623 [Ceratobasidium sp. 423]